MYACQCVLTYILNYWKELQEAYTNIPPAASFSPSPILQTRVSFRNSSLFVVEGYVAISHPDYGMQGVTHLLYT